LAANYAFGIARNRPFVDGNKRTGFVVSSLFLKLNGWGINTTAKNLYETFMNLADGSLSEDELAEWFISVAELPVSKDG
jgi:death-on-curing protein